MKTVLYNLFVERNVRSKVEWTKQKQMIEEVIDKDFLQCEYNPKTARHRSLKQMNSDLIRF